MKLAISLERGKITMSEQEMTIIDYTGYRKALQEKGPRFMAACADAWLKASEQGLAEEQAKNIMELRQELADANAEAQTTLATIAVQPDGLEKAQELLTGLAVKKAKLQSQVDSLLLQPSLQAFQVEVLDKYDLSGTGRTTGNGNTSISGMLKCVYHKTVRYYAVSEDTVGVYAANGKSSELIVAFTKADYPKLFPGSESALQRLHHVLYGEFAKPAPGTPTGRLDVAEEAYAKAGNWQTADTGLKTQNYNGNADVNLLDMTAGEWLAINATKKRGK